MVRRLGPNSKTESGSAILAVLILTVLLGLGLSHVFSQIEIVQNVIQREQSSGNAESAIAMVQMILSDPNACRTNLSADRIGSNFAELRARSDSGSIELAIPALTLGSPPVPVRVGSPLLKSIVTKLTFTSPTQLVSSQSGYKVDLQISMRSLDAKAEHTLQIPVLIELDAGGRFRTCRATTTPPSGAGMLVIENDICAKFTANANSIYFYEGRFCADHTLLPSPPAWYPTGTTISRGP